MKITIEFLEASGFVKNEMPLSNGSLVIYYENPKYKNIGQVEYNTEDKAFYFKGKKIESLGAWMDEIEKYSFEAGYEYRT